MNEERAVMDEVVARRGEPALLARLLADRFWLSPTQSDDLQRAAGELERARARADWERAARAVTALDERLDESLGDLRKSTVREYVESIVIAVAIAFFLRAFVVEAFKIPSG